MQVQLCATTKTNIQKAGADVKDSGLFAIAGHLEDEGLMSQSPSPTRWLNLCHKAHHHFSKEAEAFVRRGRGTEQGNQSRELQSSPCADKHSPFP